MADAVMKDIVFADKLFVECENCGRQVNIKKANNEWGWVANQYRDWKCISVLCDNKDISEIATSYKGCYKPFFNPKDVKKELEKKSSDVEGLRDLLNKAISFIECIPPQTNGGIEYNASHDLEWTCLKNVADASTHTE